MNTLEHVYKQTEAFSGVYFGKVISVDDPDNRNRAKVRVYGVYEEPIKKEDIPWALQATDYVATLGDEVSIRFIDGDVMVPEYIGKTVFSKEQSDSLKQLYKNAVDAKKGRRLAPVLVVSKTFIEPESKETDKIEGTKQVKTVVSDGITEDGEGVTGTASKANIQVVDTKNGGVTKSEMHPSGTFIDIHDDGTVVLHGVKDIFVIAEESKNEKVKGDYLLSIDGDLEIAAGKITFKAPHIEITGGVLKTNGTVAPNGIGPYCALPACLFTGATHTGNTVAGT
jgi:hypothetical protein